MEKETLVRKLEEASNAYYNTGNPIMSDEEYDILIGQLRDIEPDHPLLYKVGARPIGTIYKHNIPAGSQEKLKDKAAYNRWIAQTIEAGGKSYILGYKYDGLTLVLDYSSGELVRGLLRGDGRFGEDVTANCVLMQNVKRRLPVPFTGSLRGEILLFKSDFEKYFKAEGYANPRNLASGLARDQKGTGRAKHLRVIYFDCIGDDGSSTEEDKLEYMCHTLGLEVAESRYYTDPEKLWEAWLGVATYRDGLDYEIDGTVVRVNELDVQERMGMTADLRPKGQKCLKFEAQGAITELLDVELSIGSNGAIVPTGKFKPVQIGGVTVSSALLANFDEITRLDIAIGDTIYVTRRGDVIPKIEHVVDRSVTRQTIETPDKCIVCGAKAEFVGAYLMCTNDACVGQEFRRLLKYVDKRNIKYLGESTLEELYEKHNIKTPPDLYTITEEQLRNVKKGNGGIVGDGAKAIMAEIDKSRTVTLKDLLGCLSIPMLGRRQTEILMGLGIDSLDKFLNLTVHQLVALPGFKEAKSTAIINGILTAVPLIQKMLQVVSLEETPKKEDVVMTVSTKLTGQKFCFTGKIERIDGSGNRYTRDMMHDTVIMNGGIVTDKVDKNTILVQADPNSASSKSQKASSLGAVIMAEEEFWKLVA